MYLTTPTLRTSRSCDIKNMAPEKLVPNFLSTCNQPEKTRPPEDNLKENFGESFPTFSDFDARNSDNQRNSRCHEQFYIHLSRSVFLFVCGTAAVDHPINCLYAETTETTNTAAVEFGQKCWGNCLLISLLRLGNDSHLIVFCWRVQVHPNTGFVLELPSCFLQNCYLVMWSISVWHAKHRILVDRYGLNFYCKPSKFILRVDMFSRLFNYLMEHNGAKNSFLAKFAHLASMIKTDSDRKANLLSQTHNAGS